MCNTLDDPMKVESPSIHVYKEHKHTLTTQLPCTTVKKIMLSI